MPVTNASVPRFRLTRSTQITLKRRTKPVLVKGRVTPQTPTESSIQANVQPLKPEEIMMLPESERSRDFIKLFSVSEIRSNREGDDGYLADIVVWNGDDYEVVKVTHYQMGVLNHYEAIAARRPISAR